MAEPNPKTGSQSSPSLAAVPDPQAPAARPEEARSGRGGAPWWLFAVLALLLVASVWGLVSQTRHARAQAVEIVDLKGQVGELESRLSELSSQLAGFGMQRELVNVSVDKLIAQLTQLQALVRWDPSQPGAAAGPAQGDEATPEAPEASAAEPAEEAPDAPAGSSGGLDLDSVPALKPGPSLQLAPRDQV